jgi:hypothetical protein
MAYGCAPGLASSIDYLLRLDVGRIFSRNKTDTTWTGNQLHSIGTPTSSVLGGFPFYLLNRAASSEPLVTLPAL